MRDIFNRWTIVLIVCSSLFISSFLFFANGFDTDVFIVPPDDKSAVYGLNPVVSDKLRYTVLSDPSIPFTFRLCASPVVDNGDLVVYFNNPKDNNSWLLLRVYENDNLIGSSGIVRQNGFVERISGDFDNVSNVTFKVLAYEPFMYYSNGTVSVDVKISE